MRKLMVKKNYQYNIPWFELIFTALGSSVILFVIAPLISMAFATSFIDLTPAAADRQVVQSIKLTFIAAFYATVVSTLVKTMVWAVIPAFVELVTSMIYSPTPIESN